MSSSIPGLLAAIAAVSFALNLVWEFGQAPFFSSMRQLALLEASLACFRAALGDVALTLAAYLAVALAARDVRWALRPTAVRLAAFTAIGIGATILLELHAIGSGRWVYGDAMPRLPVLGVGLLPILQWLLLPAFSIVAVCKLNARLARARRR